MSRFRSVVALSGGVGGARLAYGLSRALEPSALTVVVNTGDDFEHWGLSISPDLDTVMYTLAGLSDDQRGWGLSGETFAAVGMMQRYGGADWFALGDQDLATHLVRTRALREGERLTDVTARLCRALGVGPRILPMTDAPCRTLLDTVDHGTLPFQEWFVKHRAPAVKRVAYSACPEPSPEVLSAIAASDLVVFCPSNPYVSIDPILSLPGVRDGILRRRVIAVSPIVGGKAVKGPLAEMLQALDGEAPSPAAIVKHYGGLVKAMVVERGDEADLAGIRVHATDTVMKTRKDRVRLAEAVLAFAEGLG